MFNGINPIEIHATRYPGLGYANTNPAGKPIWRFIDLHDPGRKASVGPIYNRKRDLLQELDDYAHRVWGYGNESV